jgi:predicted Zn-dependent protease
MKFLAPLLALVVTGTPPQAGKDDVVFQAMKDEMSRSMTRLHLDKYKGPYFISYTIHQSETSGVTASFGSIDRNDRNLTRNLYIDVREGDYALDSSDFSSGGFRAMLGGGGRGAAADITVDDNYDSIRHELWLNTDHAYKKAIEDLEGKKAFLAENTVKDRPDSMSKEKPVVSIGSVAHLEADTTRDAEYTRKLSAIFRDYPRIQKSMVSLDQDADTTWFVNSEGFSNRTPRHECVLVAMATAQADDGMGISDLQMFSGLTEKDLPPPAVVEKSIRDMAQRITKLAAAKTMNEEYRGPILFEGPAAAEFIAQILQPQFRHSPAPLDKNNPFAQLSKNPFEDKIGIKVLPTFITVIDDPLTKKFGTAVIPSAYDIDDEGVRAQKLTLVDKGILKTFCMSRAPTREIKQSNGHSLGGSGVSRNLYIQSSAQATPQELKAKLLQLGKDNGLKEVYIARRLWNFGTAALEPQMLFSSMFGGMSAGAEERLLPPVLLYKVSVADGKEELVRGAQFSNLTMRVLRDITATGNDMAPYPMVSMSSIGFSHAAPALSTVVTPSILVQEVELLKSSKQTELLPILKDPYFQKK